MQNSPLVQSRRFDARSPCWWTQLGEILHMNFHWFNIAIFLVWPRAFCRNIPVREDGDVCSNDVSETSILQIQDDANFASMLLHAKEACVKGTSDCWKYLSKYRTQMWQKACYGFVLANDSDIKTSQCDFSKV